MGRAMPDEADACGEQQQKRARVLSREEEDIIAWLREEGCELSNVTFGHTEMGFSVFAAHDAGAEQVMAMVAHTAVLTAEKAWDSALGEAIRGSGVECSDEMMLFMYMAEGRLETPSKKPLNKWQKYLHSMPDTAEIPSTWQADVCERELKGTTLYSMVQAERTKLLEEYERVAEALEKQVGRRIAWKEVEWAHSMYKSRSFPAKLAPGGSTCNLMLPLLDMFNHKHMEPVEWSSTEVGITYKAGKDVRQGDQLFGNYGTKPNEELLFGYGFCVPDNPADCVTINLGCQGRKEEQDLLAKKKSLLTELTFPYTTKTAADGSEALSVGPFLIRMSEQGGIPEELFTAAAVCMLQEIEEEVEVTLDEVETLQSLFQAKLSQIPSNDEHDQRTMQRAGGGIEVFAAMYRQRQREILVECLETIEEMLGGAEEGDAE